MRFKQGLSNMKRVDQMLFF